MTTVQLEVSFKEASRSLSKAEGNAVLSFLYKLLEDPSLPGLSLERVESSFKQSLWAARVSDDLRVILGREGACCALLFVGHHDDAYAWAKNREFGRNPHTGEIQLVKIPMRETESQSPPDEPIFGLDDVPRLVDQGVPVAAIPVICRKVNELELIDLAGDVLPDDVVERVLRLARGEALPPVRVNEESRTSEPLGRRFTVVQAPEELAALLARPLEEWTRFLHPEQRRIAYGDFKSAIKVTGAAGTGKTVVALHRALHLAKKGRRVLLTSFGNTLCANLRKNLQLLCQDGELERIRIATIDHVALSLSGVPGLCPEQRWKPALEAALDHSPLASNVNFRSLVQDEWEHVIKKQGLVTEAEYLSAARDGRETPMLAADRKRIWEVVQSALDSVQREGSLPPHFLARRAVDRLDAGEVKSQYDAVIVDEVQDLGAAHLRLAGRLARDEENGVTLVGDGGQRIYSGGYSLKKLGIDVRGRSFRLDLNYRSTLQILRAAERILSDGRDDLEEGLESGWSTRSLLRGPEPHFAGAESEDDLKLIVATEVGRLRNAGVQAREIAVVARINKLLETLQTSLRELGIPAVLITKENQELPDDAVRVLTMHRAKGLEFKAVIVAYASDEFIPFYKSIERAHERGDVEEVIQLDRQLLYVAMTRARDELAVFWHGKPSRFLAPVLELARA